MADPALPPSLALLKDRYSCRSFTEAPLPDHDLQEILECARWAPSGLNNQPWRFRVVRPGNVADQLARLTHSAAVIRQAAVNVVVLLDKGSVYNRAKDLQGIGACIQNMLLAAHALGYGSCWLGEILNQAGPVLGVLELDSDQYQLMGVVALGTPADPPPESRARERRPLSELLVQPAD